MLLSCLAYTPRSSCWQPGPGRVGWRAAMGLRQNLLVDGFTPALDIFTREETDALYRSYREYVDRCSISAYVNIVRLWFSISAI